MVSLNSLYNLCGFCNPNLMVSHFPRQKQIIFGNVLGQSWLGYMISMLSHSIQTGATSPLALQVHKRGRQCILALMLALRQHSLTTIRHFVHRYRMTIWKGTSVIAMLHMSCLSGEM